MQLTNTRKTRQKKWLIRHCPIGALIKITSYSVIEKKAKDSVGIVIGYNYAELNGDYSIVIFGSSRVYNRSAGSVRVIQRPYSAIKCG